MSNGIGFNPLSWETLPNFVPLGVVVMVSPTQGHPLPLMPNFLSTVTTSHPGPQQVALAESEEKSFAAAFNRCFAGTPAYKSGETYPQVHQAQAVNEAVSPHSIHHTSAPVLDDQVMQDTPLSFARAPPPLHTTVPTSPLRYSASPLDLTDETQEAVQEQADSTPRPLNRSKSSQRTHICLDCNEEGVTPPKSFTSAQDLARHRKGRHRTMLNGDKYWQCQKPGCPDSDKVHAKFDNYKHHIETHGFSVDHVKANEVRIWNEGEVKLDQHRRRPLR